MNNLPVMLKTAPIVREEIYWNQSWRWSFCSCTVKILSHYGYHTIFRNSRSCFLCTFVVERLTTFSWNRSWSFFCRSKRVGRQKKQALSDTDFLSGSPLRLRQGCACLLVLLLTCLSSCLLACPLACLRVLFYLLACPLASLLSCSLSRLFSQPSR